MRTPRAMLALAAGLAVLVLASHVDAQDAVAPVRLRTGFVPDPVVLEGRVRASREASSLGASCAGYVGDAPSFVLDLASSFGFLRVFATGPRDLVLAARAADGVWRCSEDRYGPHPSIEGEFPAGRVELWVGTSRPGLETDVSVRITELPSVRPGLGNQTSAAQGVALASDLGLEVEATEGAHGNIRLRRGFLPDPRSLEGIGGGRIDASALGASCTGRVAPRPTHVVTLLDDFDFLQLYVDGAAFDELSIVVLSPEGRFFCDVGAEERPEVSATAWAAGTYRIWVGTLGNVEFRDHRLGISEVRRVR